MQFCFVIQPFDAGGKFDKRYEDIFKPAIADAGLDAYRVDQDPGVVVPVDSIEQGIRQSAICLADISLDKPNVWYELGYAIAARKKVVMVCSDERQGSYPFDIQNRSIVKYRTGSPSDYMELQGKITERLVALVKMEERLGSLVDDDPMVPREGLATKDIAVLAALAGEVDFPNGKVTVASLKRDVERAGFTPVAFNLASLSLVKRELIEIHEQLDERNFEPYLMANLTSKGWDWIVANERMFVLTKEPSVPQVEEEEFPF
jgi:hypothetical protein